MIQSFKHRGLKRFFENNDGRRVNPDHIPRLKRILATLDAASRPEEMDAPGWGLHKLRGDLKEFYAVKVSGNLWSPHPKTCAIFSNLWQDLKKVFINK